MAENEGIVAKVLQIREIKPGLDISQLHYDKLMADAVSNGFFDGTKPAPGLSTGDRHWQPGLNVIHMRAGFQMIDPGWIGMPLWLEDQLVTGPNTVAAIEFVIGGRVGINKDSWIRIVTERSVADVTTSVKRVVLRKGGMWSKAANLREPLEIQTNGGVIGIKG